MRSIPNKTLILIGFLVTLTVVLLGIAIYTANLGKGTSYVNKISPTPTIAKTATVSFSPATLSFPAGSSPSATVDVLVTTGNSPITGAQIEADFDATVVTNVHYVPADSTNSLLGTNYTNLFVDVKTPGKIIFANGISPSTTAGTGTGSVGKISFNVVNGIKPNTTITFGPQTKITTSTAQGSVLQSTTPLTINLQ